MKRSDTGRILLFGDDVRIFLSLARAYGRRGMEVHAVPFEAGSPGLRSRYVAAVHECPTYADSPQEWLDRVLQLLVKYEFDLVIPCTDPNIIAFNHNREIFSQYRIAIPPAKAMPVFFDKEITHSTCEDLAIPVLRAARLDRFGSPDEVQSEYGLPVVIKPRRSVWDDCVADKEKVAIVESVEQLRLVWAGIADRSRYLAEKHFDGFGVGISVIASHGEILQAFQHRRLREGKGGCSSYRISERVNQDMLKACTSLCAHTGHTGVCMFEFRADKSQQNWILLETNARFWGSMPLSLSLGFDFPNLLYDLLVDGTVHPPVNYRVGMRSRNFMLDGLNLSSQIANAKIRDIPATMLDIGDFAIQPLRWITRAETSDSFVSDDLAPALAEFINLPKELRRKYLAKPTVPHDGGKLDPIL